ncbi:MAG: RHS repeat-associated core domain-containing protein [Verrucomicrobiota bacterium]
MKRFIWSGGRILQERDLTGTTVAKRFFPQGFVNESISSNYFYTFDHLGSVRDIVDASGTVVTCHEYDPWGRQIETNIVGSVTADFGYTGHYVHQPSRLNLTWFRAYDPELGRWLSREPLGEFLGDGPNLYQYVLNNPINFLDPNGLQANYMDGFEIPGRAGSAKIGSFAQPELDRELPEARAAAIKAGVIVGTEVAMMAIPGGQAGKLRHAGKVCKGGKGKKPSLWEKIVEAIEKWKRRRNSAKWKGGKILSSENQKGGLDRKQVKKYKDEMLSGELPFEGDGRIGGFKNAGNYYVGEGHHRMNAAMEIYEDTGDASYIEKLITHGFWTPKKPFTSRPFPRR